MEGMAGRIPVKRGLLGLALAAGLGYCAYRFLVRPDRRKQHVSGGGLVGKVSSLAVRPSARSGAAAFQSENLPNSASNLEEHHLRALLESLAADTLDPVLKEQMLITLANSAAFSTNHDIIRRLNGIRIIGIVLLDPSPNIKAKALNALNNLSMNLDNQEQIKNYLHDVCNEIASSPLNSELQLAGLRLAINMSVTNKYHGLLVDYIPCFLALLEQGDEVTQIHTLKVLVNLSANASMNQDLLCTKASPGLITLFGSNNTDILIRALTFATNLSENLEREQHGCGHQKYDDHSIYTLLFGDHTVFQESLVPLLHHPDTVIKELVARLFCPKR